MFLVNSFLKSGSGGGGGGGLGNTLRGLISGARGGSCGGGGGGTATRFLGGVVSATGETAAKYNPGPPPPRTHYSNIEPNESERVRQFRRLFAQLAGDDMEVSATELMNILNKVVTRHPDLKTDGLDTDTCCSMVAVMDSDTTGKMGTIGSSKLPGDFEAAGFRLNDHLYNMTIGRYSDEVGNMDFDNFISCLVRLDAMFRAFKSLDKDGTGQTQVNIQEWLQLTMYS
ncbi:calpain small subunit 1 [Camelus ferus]|nr:calpain small subunit 1 [Camelus ferus]